MFIVSLFNIPGAALGLAALGLATAADAQAINGRYDGTSCSSDYRGELALDIAWPVITFYESECQVTGTVAGAVNTYTTTCSGEGSTWDGQIGLWPQVDGSLVLDLYGETTTYSRCQ
jgi:hypothetical protein